jgi:hypothetical protein
MNLVPDPETGRPRRETNVEMLTRIMEFSKNGGLMQGFIIHALVEYSAQVARGNPSEFHSPFISGHAWVSCAQELKDELTKHLGAR